MKILWQKKFGKEDVSLVFLDERNYSVGKYVLTPTKQDDGTMKDVESLQGATYYNSIENAVRFIAKKTADSKCTDLHDWLRHFSGALTELKNVFEGN